LDIRYHIDPDTGLPHIFGHGVSCEEVEQILAAPWETRRGDRDSQVLLGRTLGGRLLRVIVVPDQDGQGVFVVTAFDLAGKPLKAFRRRQRKRGRS